MNASGGTEVADHETEMPPAKGLACVVPVLVLLGAHLFFASVFTAALAFSPMLAFVSIWTYATTLPFALLAILCIASHIQKMECVAYPAITCAMFAPFITWYARTACKNNYFAVCILLLCISVPWLLQSVNRFLEKIFNEWFSDGDSGATISQALHLSFKGVIYFVIAPLCADMVGIIYRAWDSESALPYILDNITAQTPTPLAFLHYGGMVFALFFESAIAMTMAYKIIRKNDDRTDHSVGLLD